MKTHGSAPSPAQYAEFAGIVQSRLWPAIKNRLSGEEIQALITGNGPEEVLRRLRKTFTAGKNESAPTTPPCPFFAEEEVASDMGYPPEYTVKPIAEQLLIWSRLLPNFSTSSMLAYSKNLPGRPEGAEGPFVVPIWQQVGSSYQEATKKVLSLLDIRYRFGRKTLESALVKVCQSERTIVAEKILSQHDGGNPLGYPYRILWAQFGFLHRGRSTRRVRSLYAPNEFGLGAFAVASMLLTHLERFSNQSVSLGIICPGDECPNNEGELCYAPLFKAGITWLELESYWHGGSEEDDQGPATAFLPTEPVA